MVDKENNDNLNGHSFDLETHSCEGRGEESDSDTINDSVSSQGDTQIADYEKVEKANGVPKKIAKNDFSGSNSRSHVKSNRATNNSQIKHSTSKKATNLNKRSSKATTKTTSDKNSKNVEVHSNCSSESSEGVDCKVLVDIKEVEITDQASNGTQRIDFKVLVDVKEVEFTDQASNGTQSVESDDGTVTAVENGDHESKVALDQRIGEMELKVEKLEEELREVAALEISIYSVVPEHGSSAHKVHTPARRLSRLYIHACKNWSQDKRATVARNTVSGLVLVAKSCGNDVPRLSFWLSNTVVLRNIIAQAFGSSCHSSYLTRIFELNGGGKSSKETSPPLKWKSGSGTRRSNKQGFLQFIDNWQETGTFTAALEKIESWIFSRIVESIWWQTLTPNMQSRAEDLNSNKTIGRLLGPPLGDQQQGSFSINLWKNAFQDAFKRLCPVRAGGHECGCLLVLSRMVMEHCVARLDVAMFNAILRESAHEIPTDPVSDPILDSTVLPILAGDLSFGSGAQLKNSVGNWSRWLSDSFGIDTEDSVKEDQHSSEDDDRQGGSGPKCFLLLNALSDLLMLPKDMLLDRSVRTEVCPSISLPLLKRILCNFSPDEFCPDPVPGSVLEAINAECIIERRLSGETAGGFPYAAAPVIYTPPSSADVAEKVAELGGKPELARSASVIQRKGYTSDEELEELDSPLTFIIDKLPLSPSITANRNGKHEDETGGVGPNSRYELLREVWLA